MRLLLASDIHLEHGGPIPELPSKDEYDVAIFAGDIGRAPQAVFWIAENIPCEHRIYVPGNHEYYRYHYESANAFMVNKGKELGVHTLAPGSVSISDKYEVIGATLWSDLELKDFPPQQWIDFEYGIADFSLIGYGGITIHAEDMIALYKQEKAFIEQEIQRVLAEGKTPIVVTHFVPTQLAIAERFRGDRLNPYFINDCDDLMEKYNLPIWIFGHSHVRMDFVHPTAGTRIVSNAFGYPGEMEDPEWKIIEL